MAASTYKIKQTRVRTNVKKWTEQENLSILDYLQETIMLGHTIEKPTVKHYYKCLIKEKKLQDCDAMLVRNKVRNFLTLYKKALEWQNQAGQAVLEAEGEEKLQDILHKRYPYIDQFEKIWGSKLSIKNLSPHAATTQIGAPQEISPDEQLDLVEMFVEDDSEVNDCLLRISNVRSEYHSSSSTERSNSVESEMEEIPVAEKSTIIRTKKLSKSQKRMLRRPNPYRLPKMNENWKSAYLEIVHLQEETNKNNLEVQKEKLEFERFKFQKNLETKINKIQLQRDEFEERKETKARKRTEKMLFERRKFDEELELKKQQIDLEREKLLLKKLELENQREIRLMELNVEKLKLDKLNNPKNVD